MSSPGADAYHAASGSGSRVSRGESMETSMFSVLAPGCMRIESHTDGALGLDALALRDGQHREAAFLHCLAEHAPERRRRR